MSWSKVDWDILKAYPHPYSWLTDHEGCWLEVDWSAKILVAGPAQLPAAENFMNMDAPITVLE